MSSPPPSYAASQAHCSTCAQPLGSSSSVVATSTNEKVYPEKEKEKHATLPLQQACCNRWVCGQCIDKNSRFATYCAFCPSSSSRLLPPSYSPFDVPSTSTSTAEPLDPQPLIEDVVHHLTPTDTLPTLSLLYSVPPHILRQHNALWSDHLLHARQTISIPTAYYQGPSRSCHPFLGEEEEDRRRKVKRWQIKTKCVLESVAEVYLEEVKWNVDEAVKRWWEDEGWEKREGGGKGRVAGNGKGEVGSIRKALRR